MLWGLIENPIITDGNNALSNLKSIRKNRGTVLTDPLKLIYRNRIKRQNAIEIGSAEDQNAYFSLLEEADGYSRRAHLSIGYSQSG